MSSVSMAAAKLIDCFDPHFVNPVDCHHTPQAINACAYQKEEGIRIASQRSSTSKFIIAEVGIHRMFELRRIENVRAFEFQRRSDEYIAPTGSKSVGGTHAKDVCTHTGPVAQRSHNIATLRLWTAADQIQDITHLWISHTPRRHKKYGRHFAS